MSARAVREEIKQKNNMANAFSETNVLTPLKHSHNVGVTMLGMPMMLAMRNPAKNNAAYRVDTRGAALVGQRMMRNGKWVLGY